MNENEEIYCSTDDSDVAKSTSLTNGSSPIRINTRSTETKNYIKDERDLPDFSDKFYFTSDFTNLSSNNVKNSFARYDLPYSKFVANNVDGGTVERDDNIKYANGQQPTEKLLRAPAKRDSFLKSPFNSGEAVVGKKFRFCLSTLDKDHKGNSGRAELSSQDRDIITSSSVTAMNAVNASLVDTKNCTTVNNSADRISCPSSTMVANNVVEQFIADIPVLNLPAAEIDAAGNIIIDNNDFDKIHSFSSIADYDGYDNFLLLNNGTAISRMTVTDSNQNGNGDSAVPQSVTTSPTRCDDSASASSDDGTSDDERLNAGDYSSAESATDDYINSINWSMMNDMSLTELTVGYSSSEYDGSVPISLPNSDHNNSCSLTNLSNSTETVTRYSQCPDNSVVIKNHLVNGSKVNKTSSKYSENDFTVNDRTAAGAEGDDESARQSKTNYSDDNGVGNDEQIKLTMTDECNNNDNLEWEAMARKEDEVEKEQEEPSSKLVRPRRQLDNTPSRTQPSRQARLENFSHLSYYKHRRISTPKFRDATKRSTITPSSNSPARATICSIRRRKKRISGRFCRIIEPEPQPTPAVVPIVKLRKKKTLNLGNKVGGTAVSQVVNIEENEKNSIRLNSEPTVTFVRPLRRIRNEECLSVNHLTDRKSMASTEKQIESNTESKMNNYKAGTASSQILSVEGNGKNGIHFNSETSVTFLRSIKRNRNKEYLSGVHFASRKNTAAMPGTISQFVNNRHTSVKNENDNDSHLVINSVNIKGDKTRTTSNKIKNAEKAEKNYSFANSETTRHTRPRPVVIRIKDDGYRSDIDRKNSMQQQFVTISVLQPTNGSKVGTGQNTNAEETGGGNGGQLNAETRVKRFANRTSVAAHQQFMQVSQTANENCTSAGNDNKVTVARRRPVSTACAMVQTDESMFKRNNYLQTRSQTDMNKYAIINSESRKHFNEPLHANSLINKRGSESIDLINKRNLREKSEGKSDLYISQCKNNQQSLMLPFGINNDDLSEELTNPAFNSDKKNFGNSTIIISRVKSRNFVTNKPIKTKNVILVANARTNEINGGNDSAVSGTRVSSYKQKKVGYISEQLRASVKNSITEKTYLNTDDMMRNDENVELSGSMNDVGTITVSQSTSDVPNPVSNTYSSIKSNATISERIASSYLRKDISEPNCRRSTGRFLKHSSVVTRDETTLHCSSGGSLNEFSSSSDAAINVDRNQSNRTRLKTSPSRSDSRCHDNGSSSLLNLKVDSTTYNNSSDTRRVANSYLQKGYVSNSDKMRELPKQSAVVNSFRVSEMTDDDGSTHKSYEFDSDEQINSQKTNLEFSFDMKSDQTTQISDDRENLSNTVADEFDFQENDLSSIDAGKGIIGLRNNRPPILRQYGKKYYSPEQNLTSLSSVRISNSSRTKSPSLSQCTDSNSNISGASRFSSSLCNYKLMKGTFADNFDDAVERSLQSTMTEYNKNASSSSEIIIKSEKVDADFEASFSNSHIGTSMNDNNVVIKTENNTTDENTMTDEQIAIAAANEARKRRAALAALKRKRLDFHAKRKRRRRSMKRIGASKINSAIQDRSGTTTSSISTCNTVLPSTTALTYLKRGKRKPEKKAILKNSLPIGRYLALKDNEWEPAEILAKRADKSNSYVEYFVHYEEWDKIYDCWLTRDSIKALPQPINTKYKTQKKCKRLEVQRLAETSGKNMYKNKSENNDTDKKTRIKYTSSIVLGGYEIQTWYYSPYPAPFVYEPKLWICEFCFKYYPEEHFLIKHEKICQRNAPRGCVVYNKDDIYIYQIDGAVDKLYCQNLCLLTTLFVDNKSICFDVDGFLFYVLCKMDTTGGHILGYFSKEKDSSEANNLACILILPPYQKMGYGSLLISFSYELNKMDGYAGTPERPISELGMMAYNVYWSWAVLNELDCLAEKQAGNNNELINICNISCNTGIVEDDICRSLQSMGLINYWRNRCIVCISPSMIKEKLKDCKLPKMLVSKECIKYEHLIRVKRDICCCRNEHCNGVKNDNNTVITAVDKDTVKIEVHVSRCNALHPCICHTRRSSAGLGRSHRAYYSNDSDNNADSQSDCNSHVDAEFSINESDTTTERRVVGHHLKNLTKRKCGERLRRFSSKRGRFSNKLLDRVANRKQFCTNDHQKYHHNTSDVNKLIDGISDSEKGDDIMEYEKIYRHPDNPRTYIKRRPSSSSMSASHLSDSTRSDANVYDFENSCDDSNHTAEQFLDAVETADDTDDDKHSFSTVNNNNEDISRRKVYSNSKLRIKA